MLCIGYSVLVFRALVDAYIMPISLVIEVYMLSAQFLSLFIDIYVQSLTILLSTDTNCYAKHT